MKQALAALAAGWLLWGCQCNGMVSVPGCDAGACDARCSGASCPSDGGHPGDNQACADSVQSAMPAGATWQPTGPSGGKVTALLAVPGAVLAGTGYTRAFGLISGRGGAIYRSTDEGKTFAPALRLPGSTVSALVAVSGSNTVYAAVSSSSGASMDGVYVSTDLGQTFMPASQGLFAGARVTALAVAAGTPERVYALVLGTPAAPQSAATSLFVREGGADWAQLAAAGLQPNVGGPALALTADAADRDRVYLADGAIFYASTDAGAGFAPVAQMTDIFGGQSFANVTLLRADPSDAQHLLLGTTDDGLRETHDQGHTWARASSPSFIYDAQFSAGALWVGTSDTGLLTGADSASLARTGDCLVDPSVTAVAALPGSSAVVAGTTGGLYHSSDGAKTFSPSRGLDELVGRVIASGDSLWLASPVGVYRSKDSGDHWARVGAGIGTICIADVQLDPFDSDVAWVATDQDLYETESPPGSLLRLQLSDGGFRRAGIGLAANVAAVRPDPNVPGRIWAYQRAATGDAVGSVATGVARSDDDGVSFVSVGPASTSLALKSTFRFSPLAVRSDSVVFAGIADAGAQVWAGDAGASATIFASATAIPYGVQLGPTGDVYLVGRNGPGILHSTDAIAFTEEDDGLDGGAGQVFQLAFFDGGTFAATQAGVWLSTGGAYSELGGFSQEPVVWSVAVAPAGDVVVVTTNVGVYRLRVP